MALTKSSLRGWWMYLLGYVLKGDVLELNISSACLFTSFLFFFFPFKLLQCSLSLLCSHLFY
jgi:hypothetical protein